jgi:hypothetical protein
MEADEPESRSPSTLENFIERTESREGFDEYHLRLPGTLLTDFADDDLLKLFVHYVR